MKRKEFIKKSVIGATGMGIALSSLGRVLSEAEKLAAAQNPIRSVARVFPAARVNVAPTLAVNRTLPMGRNVVIDPFILLDHFGPVHVKPGEGVGVPPHPHRGFEPVTFLFEGHVEHKDSLGNTGLLDAGGIQWMTSGKGIIHSEDMAKRYDGDGGLLHGIQLWVNLPKKHKMVDPGYQNITAGDIPLVDCENGKVKVKVAAGKVFGTQGPASTFTPVTALMITMKPGSKLEVPIPAHHNSFLQLLEGSLMVKSKSHSGSNLVLYNNDGSKALIETDPASPKDIRLLFLAGETINEPVVQYGPFVMNSQDEIRKAYADYQAGKMGSIDF